MFSRSARQEPPPAQWKQTIGRIFRIRSKFKSTNVETSSSGAFRLETQSPTKPTLVNSIGLEVDDTAGSTESINGPAHRTEPPIFGHADRVENGNSTPASLPQNSPRYPPLNPLTDPTISFRSVVTTFSPSSHGDAHNPGQACYDGVMIATFSLNYKSSNFQQSSPSATVNGSPRGSEPNSQDRRFRAKQSTRSASSDNINTATSSTLYEISESLPQDELKPLEMSKLIKRLDKRPVFEGTYSSVFVGEYNGSKVAIKEIRTVKSNHATERKFRRELYTWWKLRHPNILPLLGYLHEDRALISPWMEGGTAAEYIKQELSPLKRLHLFSDVVNGLEFLHNFKPGVVHADLKPANVLITEEGRGRICDFGLIHLFQEEMNTGMTTTTAHTGTTRYLSYELVRNMGRAKPTKPSDIYALGCIGMEFLFCRPPHWDLGDHYYEIIQRIGQGYPPANLPTNEEDSLYLLWCLLNNCWALHPEQRPTISELQTWFQMIRMKILSGLQALYQQGATEEL